MSETADERTAQRIRQNVAAIQQRIEDAAGRSNRSADDVTLIGVTKYVGPELAAFVAKAGVSNLGESRPQALFEKREALSESEPGIRWHLIGSLQRNKARRAVLSADLIQSADRWKLIEFLDSLAEQEGLPSVNVLLEINISGDESKHGLTPEELRGTVERLAETPRISALGLMAMGGRGAPLEEVRRQFVELRELAENCRAIAPENAPLGELSMGMSGDFEVAIEEGATMVRVGSSLFEGVAR